MDGNLSPAKPPPADVTELRTKSLFKKYLIKFSGRKNEEEIMGWNFNRTNFWDSGGFFLDYYKTTGSQGSKLSG
jgi:hypothetical protein